jgi:uncharacterized protein YdhG (YjbR/CyaY superfamily)
MQRFKNDSGGQLPDVEFYIMKYDSDKRERLQKIRRFMIELFPDSTERIYFGIPTVEMGGKIILQYAAYKKHITLIIGDVHSAYLKENYPEYHYTNYTVYFPDDEAFPDAFVKEVLAMINKINRTIKPFK